MKYILVLVFVCVETVIGGANGISPLAKSFEEKWKCVPIHVDFCKDIEYNATIEMSASKPNPYTKTRNQDETKSELDKYKSLVDSGCSDHLKLFLCSVYLPVCNPAIENAIPVCKFFCEDVKSKCKKTIKLFNNYIDALSCEIFPEKNDEKTPCSDGGLPQPGPTTTTTISNTKSVTTNTQKKTDVEKTSPPKNCCKVYRNIRNCMFVKKIQECALDCTKDGLFTSGEKKIAEKWMTALAVICVFLCLLALVTVWFNYHVTCYPERSIVFITSCYFFYSLAYVIRIAYTREEVTCQKEDGRSYLLVDGAANVSCAATFLLVYSFFMMQSVWWVILCLSWFLSAGMKWTPEEINSKSFIFHIVAWGLPCCKTVIVLVWRKIDVNELTGICSVGNRPENLSALRWLVLAPLFTFLIMGTVFLVFGIFSLFRLPTPRQDQLAFRNKLKQLLLPVGAFGTIHTLLSAVILGSYFYEYVNKNSWYFDSRSNGPELSMFILRIIFDFSIGIVASCWILMIHMPKFYRKVLAKLHHTDLLLSKHPTDPIQSAKSQMSPNETFI